MKIKINKIQKNIYLTIDENLISSFQVTKAILELKKNIAERFNVDVEKINIEHF